MKQVPLRKVSNEMLHELWLSGQLPYRDYVDEVTRRNRKPLRDVLTKFVQRLNDKSTQQETGTEVPVLKL